jgi:hypothetical protein
MNAPLIGICQRFVPRLTTAVLLHPLKKSLRYDRPAVNLERHQCLGGTLPKRPRGNDQAIHLNPGILRIRRPIRLEP